MRRGGKADQGGAGGPAGQKGAGPTSMKDQLNQLSGRNKNEEGFFSKAYVKVMSFLGFSLDDGAAGDDRMNLIYTEDSTSYRMSKRGHAALAEKKKKEGEEFQDLPPFLQALMKLCKRIFGEVLF
jgi:hypothetical protein